MRNDQETCLMASCSGRKCVSFAELGTSVLFMSWAFDMGNFCVKFG